MTITFPCSGCGKQYKAGSESAGKQMKCTVCGTVIRVPVPRHIASPASTQATGEVTCPSCRSLCRVMPEWRGKTLECPTCKQRFTVPVSGGSSAHPGRASQSARALHGDGWNDTASSPSHGYLDESEAADSSDFEYSKTRPGRRASSDLPAWLSSPRFWVTAGGVAVAVVALVALVLGPIRRAVTDFAHGVSNAVNSSGQPLPPPDLYIPRSGSVVLVRVSELTDGRLNSLGAAKQEIMDVPEQALSAGLELREIDHMYFTRDVMSNVMVAILNRPIGADTASSGAVVCDTYKDFTIFETPDHEFRFCPHPRMVVQSDDLEWMEFKLHSGLSNWTSSPFEFPVDCQIAIRSTEMGSGPSLGLLGWNLQWAQGAGPGTFRGPIWPRGSVAGLSFVSGRVDARFNIEFANASEATQYKSVYDSSISTVRQQLARQSQQPNQDAAANRMRDALLAANMTTNGNTAGIRFSISSADLASQSTAQGTVPQGLPGQKKPKPPKEPFVTVRVTGVPPETENMAIVQHIRELAGGDPGYSASWWTDTVIARLRTTVSAEELGKRIDFGEVTRVKRRGITVAADSKRLAALAKPTN